MGTNTPKKNRNAQTSADQQLIDGLNKNAATIKSLVIAGTSMPTKTIIATLQSRIDAANAIASTRAAWQAAIVTRKQQLTQTKTFESGLRQALLVAFAGQVDTLADFGLTGRKAATISPEAKVARTAKAMATRAARHTMGKVQKSKITGETPNGSPAAPASPAPAASPALPGTTPITTAPTAAPIVMTAPVASAPALPPAQPAPQNVPIATASPAAMPVVPAPVPASPTIASPAVTPAATAVSPSPQAVPIAEPAATPVASNPLPAAPAAIAPAKS